VLRFAAAKSLSDPGSGALLTQAEPPATNCTPVGELGRMAFR
jgi:hypothetical protein